MSQKFRLGKHRGEYVAVVGHGRAKRRRRLGLAARPNFKAEAQKQVHKLNALDTRPETDGAVASIFAAYVADREHDGVPSVFRMRQAWKPLAPHFGHLTPDMINKKVCTDYIRARRSKGVTNGGIKTELDYLSSALGFGKRENLFAGDRPAITRPPAGRPRDRWLEKGEARRLVAGAVAFHIKLFIVGSTSTAARPSHLLQLTWDRVDLKRRICELDDPERDETKKGRARVPINDEFLEMLKVAKDMATSEFVIEYNGGPVLRVWKGITEAARRAKIKGVTPYVLRHTAGVWMAQAGVPMAEISQYMGHSSIRVTERVYARFHPDHMRKASDALTIGRDEAPQLEDLRDDV